MKKGFFSFIGFFIVLNCFAKKINYPIEVVAAMADLIVVGEIETVNSNSYQFKIKHTVKGKTLDVVKVQMFKEWTCDRRFKPAVVSQKMFLFLVKRLGKYELINGSNGELFIESEIVKTTVNNKQPSVVEFVAALRDFTSCYTLKNKSYLAAGRNIFLQLKSEAKIKELALKSDNTKWFFEKIKRYEIEKILNE